MKARIRQVRKESGLSRQDFADKIGVSLSSLDSYEAGRRTPVNTAINAICEKFYVRKEWLLEGSGPMHLPRDSKEKVLDFANEIIRQDGFKSRLVSLLADMTEEEWSLLEKMAKRLQDNKKEG